MRFIIKDLNFVDNFIASYAKEQFIKYVKTFIDFRKVPNLICELSGLSKEDAIEFILKNVYWNVFGKSIEFKVNPTKIKNTTAEGMLRLINFGSLTSVSYPIFTMAFEHSRSLVSALDNKNMLLKRGK